MLVGGPAFLSQRISQGDTLIAINGVAVQGLEQKDTIKLLQVLLECVHVCVGTKES